MTARPGKVTQREIARIAGVSQTVVSMVLNDRDDTNVRIPAATRERVRRAIEQSTYVADPAARRLAGLDNKILGVFTYESALTPESMDFYGPLLNGIERAAERLGCDLLFFTGSPVEEGRRRLFHRDTRLRLADGCVLLGQQMDGEDLERLVAESFPFVAVGRRDETDADVPYVGIDYGALTATLITRAAELGHRRAVYVHRDRDSPTARDRLAAITTSTGQVAFTLTAVGDDLTGLPGIITAQGATAVFAEDAFLVEDIALVLSEAGITAPAQVSLAALGEVRGHRIAERPLTGFQVPRQQIAAEALALLQQLISTPADEQAAITRQRLLQGDVEYGGTLVARGGAR
ncbi:LacI family DNA-binding transcriptional regulator [Phytomonospora endophytica]|uniref:DNA-binding LacI/PurR family transcriptional regulator n=1 Tax=Phytomonospora endophytica TaxID=714109 RepID=A0A841FZM8_9ACTN|nr:LacI family DNA-binding transcriptional regulator [Phytomonospora endophytica]MBB6037899.1 DNA-binding LacI/PurR family transcriptional regulator [Phytomonospora endophytica]GIG68799.1 LacI family transcriptional regulator [Phytomonospora endophytica]